MFKVFSIYSISIYIPFIIGFLLLPVYTKFLTPEDYGIRAIVLLAILAFQVFSDVGVNWIIRAKYFLLKSKHEIAQYISTLLFISLTIRLVLSIIMYSTKDFIYSQIFHGWSLLYSNLLNIQIGVFLLHFIRNLTLPILILEKSTGKFLILTLCTYLINIVTSLFLLISANMGIASLFYGELAGTIFCTLLSIVFLKDYIIPRFDVHVIRDVINIGLPAMPKNIIGQVQRNINKYFIQLYMTPTDLGIFQKSDFLYGGFRGLQKAIGNTVAPNNLKKIASKEEDRETGKIIIQFIYFLSVLVLFTTFYLEDIFRLMGVNEAFWVCAKYAPLYGFNVLISSFVLMFIHNILVSEKTYLLLVQTAIILFFSYAANIILVPKYGIIGGILSITIVSIFSALILIIVSEIWLSYKTKINYWMWIAILATVLLIYFLDYNGHITSTGLKSIILLVYMIIVVIVDKYFVSAIAWDKIFRKFKEQLNVS